MTDLQDTDLKDKVALIVGAGSGLSASIARAFAGAGMKIALAARGVGDLGPLATEIGAATFVADATDPAAVTKLYTDVGSAVGDPYAVVYNASYRTRGPLVDLDPAEVEKSIAVTAFGGFLVAQEAVRRMLPKGQAQFCSPAHRRASRVTPSRRPSPWASSRCAGLRKAWRANWRRRAFMSPM